MNEYSKSLLQGVVVEEGVYLTLHELCRASHAPLEQVQIWVTEGVLEPTGQVPQDWRFTGQSLRRARLALRLTRDLEVNASGVALALDLLDEIAVLQAQLKRMQLSDVS